MTDDGVDRSQLRVDPDRPGCVTDGIVTAAVGQLSWFTVPDDLADVLGRDPTPEEVRRFLGDTGLSRDARAVLDRATRRPDEQIGGLDLCRLPVFAPPRAGQARNLKQPPAVVPGGYRDPWTRCGQLNGVDVFVDGPLRMGRDEYGLDFLVRRFADTNFTADFLPIDLADLAAFQTGRPRSEMGRKDCWLAWESLDRLHARRVRFQAETEHGPIGVAIHFISTMVDDAGPLRFDPKRKIPPSTFAGIVLDPVFVYLLRTGRFVWHLGRLDALRGNPRAMKLGRFARAESFRPGEHKLFAVFEAEPGQQPTRTRRTPAIADELAYTWTQPGRAARKRAAIVADLRKDCAYFSEHDPEYAARVVPAKGRQMWNVELWQKPPQPQLLPVDNSPDVPDPPVPDAGPTGTKSRTHRYAEDGSNHEQVQGKTDAGDGPTSVLTSVSHVSRATGDAEEAEDRPCRAAVLTAAADPDGALAEVVGPLQIAALARAVCGQVCRASEGASCDDPDSCEAFAALRECGAKWRAYLTAGKVRTPGTWVRAIIASAHDDPAELLGDTADHAEDRLKRLRKQARDRARHGHLPPPDLKRIT